MSLSIISVEESIKMRRALIEEMSRALLESRPYNMYPQNTRLYNALSRVMALWKEGRVVNEGAK